MKLDGRRESSNVDDRRGASMGKTVGGVGIGGLLIIGLLTLLFGGNPSDVMEMASQMGGTTAVGSDWTPTPEEEELASFSKKILAGTEDVWTKIFRQYGKTYDPPKLVLYSGRVQTSSGVASSDMGPFYNSADQCVYIDLSFFTSMKKEIGADGDFAYAYVIAHEVGHHVQYLLGTLSQVHQQMSRVSKEQSNQLSVRLELQADFYAGVWAHNDNKMFGSLEEGDIDEGLAVAAKIGDDYLQKKAYGRTMPETFNHGTSAQRSRWLKKGISTGDIRQGDTFSGTYSSL
ncbi:MAG: neutral zinc metallopeptidase [Bacteroidaceae bacterium]|nr:neutral zinc metallopeptidase [Bacteroidaceae bacterium]